MNKAIISGRLTRDAVVRYSQGNEPKAVARFTLAVDRKVKRDQNTQSADFISCVAFGKQGEFMEKFGKQGVKFEISGRIQTGSYTNRDGAKVYTTEVICEDIEFGESKASSERNAAAGGQQEAPTADYTDDGFMNIPDGIEDELPFG